MKTFTSIKHFEQRLQHDMDWDDYITVGNRLYKMVEYGTGCSNDYMLFQNKPTKHMIQVEYHCPSFNKGVQTKEYKFLSVFGWQADELYRY